MKHSHQNIVAIYPGTFDPLTLGHIDLIFRAARLFSQVIVAVARSDRKSPIFSLEQRVELAKLSIAESDTNDSGAQSNIEVVGFSGLLADFAADNGATVLLRGVRTVADFEYENQLAEVNRSLGIELESVLLTPKGEFAHISSTIVRDVAAHGGKVDNFVTPAVSQALKNKFA
jgi:pantetheine-phosphate adenylyltransferase